METLKQIVIHIPQGVVTGLILNGTLISLAYFLIWKKFKKKLQNRRIQITERVDINQIKREIKNSMYTLLAGATLSSIVIYLSKQGYTKIYTDFNDHHALLACSGFFILLLVDDTWFYWCHRLLHHPKLYRLVHFEHHKSVDVNPFTSMSFHFVEPVLLTLWILPVSFLFPIYAPVLMLVQLWGQLDNLKAHLGYEFYPAKLNKSWFRFLTTSTHHNMHHSKFNGNYGVHFRIWDRLLGTEFKDYEHEYDKIHARKNTPPDSGKIENRG